MKRILNNKRTDRRSSESGFTGADVLVAIAIITLFTGLITSISYNIYLATSSTQRMSQANSYISDVFAQADKLYYDDVTANGIINTTDTSYNADDLILYFNNKYNTNSNSEILASATTLVSGGNGGWELSTSLNTPYQIGISMQYYTPSGLTEIPPDGTNSLDLVKIITMDVRYKVGGKQQDLVMSKVKQREVLVTPNAPDLNALQTDADINLPDESTILPVKYNNNTWTVCSPNDANWYNYDNGYWATVFVPDSNYLGQTDTGYQLTSEDLGHGARYVWIPRYSYDGTNVEFLYGTTNYTVNTINTKSRIT